MIRSAAVIILFLVCASASAQNNNITIKSDPLLDSLIEKNIDHNKTIDGMPGYRIQIYFGSERKGATEAKTRFLQSYPETEAYMIYQQPYFKVRVGDFRTKFEAHAMYKRLLNEFDKVFIVPDKINPPRL